MKYSILNNDVKMPMLGYGVYQLTPKECERCVLDALDVGYRLIDTAQAFENEEAVGAAIKSSGVARNELFISAKVWISNDGQNRAARSIDESLGRLQSDYIDLLLVHQPVGDYYGTYRAMETAYKMGKVRAIGVSNFNSDRLVELCEYVDILPAVNQVETHPLLQQKQAHEIMKTYHVQHQCWGPVAEGRRKMFQNQVIARIAHKHGKSMEQVILRFLIEKDVAVILKSTQREQMRESMELFDFQLTQEERAAMEELDENESAFYFHYDSATVDFLTKWKAG